MAKYNDKELAETSKFLSFVLRHKPEAIGIVLDREGWADIDKEGAAAEALVAKGCVIIGQHADSTGAPAAVQKLQDAISGMCA